MKVACSRDPGTHGAACAIEAAHSAITALWKRMVSRNYELALAGICNVQPMRWGCCFCSKAILGWKCQQRRDCQSSQTGRLGCCWNACARNAGVRPSIIQVGECWSVGQRPQYVTP